MRYLMRPWTKFLDDSETMVLNQFWHLRAIISLIYALDDKLIAYQLTEVTKAFKNLDLKSRLSGLLYAESFDSFTMH